MPTIQMKNSEGLSYLPKIIWLLTPRVRIKPKTPKLMFLTTAPDGMALFLFLVTE